MAKSVKRAQLKRRKAPAKKTIARKNVKGNATEYKVSNPSYVNVMEVGSSENKSGDIMLGSVSGVAAENKNQRLELRLTKPQKEVISKASSVSGFKNVSDYILHIAITDSKKVIHEQQIFELSERDRISFMETLDNPPEPGKNLKKAMANYLSFKRGE